ncbi:MAG: type II secretion system protein [Planctomycetota bacterium]
MKIAQKYTKKPAKTEDLRPKAFTLVELIVVISTIALLLAILAPVINKARAIASRTTCRSNLYNISLALKMYLDEYHETMPPASRFPSLEDPGDPTGKPPITEFILPYLAQPEIFKCPADTVKKYYLSQGSSYEYNSQLGGKRASTTRTSQRYGLRNEPVMYDYDPFHGQAGKPGSKNYLYADGHIGTLEMQ